MAIEIFNRFELKYLISIDEYYEMRSKLLERMTFDSYGNNDGKYNIISLYFDSAERGIYYETKNKLSFRQKLRLRVYDRTSIEDQAFFEIKQKFKNVVNKRRTVLSLNDAYKLIKNKPNIFSKELPPASNTQILKEVIHFRNQYELEPDIIVSYDRQAFVGVNEPDLRVTFDYNLMTRDYDLRLENGPYGHHFIHPDLVVLEIKVSNSVPLWLSNIVSEMNLSRKSVSKFCTSVELAEELALKRKKYS
ncbi:polyphosphate polymerase domain-containing protein [Jeotgalibacillus sp. R-1-5s-1]|uniref:polyphosphate polymerase domain-containing protein n=1 Tax=Jeotgalibacillus sp. R-1-5s-1 TaxID=2555897 RepID=UPI001069F304|nr:polyphosphate polymerase domain-containing protein [Jeotgalibacillus sp. R-1-5s-1]TFD97092.1 polyphosphate polymerase domain-containing protein [Jeotgalibacillus sp. R-1-5s-1]